VPVESSFSAISLGAYRTLQNNFGGINDLDREIERYQSIRAQGGGYPLFSILGLLQLVDLAPLALDLTLLR